MHRYSGKVLAREDDFNEKMRARYDAPFLDMHRVDLQLALYERAKELGVRFRLGERIEAVDPDAAELTTVSGETARADLLVAADGLWSRSRACFLKGSGDAGDEDKPLATGDLAYRVVLNLDDIEDPELRAWVERPTVHFWIGPGAHCVGYSMRAGKMYNLVVLVPDDLPPGVSRQAGSVEELRARFRDWDPILRRFLDAVDGVEKWKLMHSGFLASFRGVLC